MTASSTSADRRRWLALLVISLGYLMVMVDMTIVNVALPSIGGALDIGQASLTWVIDAYLITYGSFLLLAGRISDLAGRRRMFLLGIGLFTLASIACGVAPSGGTLIAGRLLQGIGAAVIGSVTMAILIATFTEAADRTRALGLFTFVVAAGGSLGLIAGGVLTEALDWRWCFFVNVPVGLAVLAGARALLPADGDQAPLRGVDWLGSILMTAAAMTGIYAIITSTHDGFGSTAALVPATLAVALAAAFVVLERRVPAPIMPPRLLRDRRLAGASVARGLLASGIFSTFFLGALYLERVKGYGALEIGVAFVPQTILFAAMATGVTGRLMGRFGLLPVAFAGMAFSFAGVGLLAFLGPDTGYAPVLLASFVAIGIGGGTAMMPLLSIAMENVAPGDAGIASGIANVAVQLTAALVLAVLGSVATGHANDLVADGAAPAAAFSSGYALAFGIGAAVIVLGMGVAAASLRAPRPAPAAAAPGVVTGR